MPRNAHSPHDSAAQGDALERLAHRRVRARVGWLIHATVYAVVNGALALHALQLGQPLHAGPLLGWGLGFALHGAVVWLALPGSGWRERWVQRERDRLVAQRAGR